MSDVQLRVQALNVWKWRRPASGVNPVELVSHDFLWYAIHGLNWYLQANHAYADTVITCPVSIEMSDLLIRRSGLQKDWPIHGWVRPILIARAFKIGLTYRCAWPASYDSDSLATEQTFVQKRVPLMSMWSVCIPMVGETTQPYFKNNTQMNSLLNTFEEYLLTREQ